MYLSRLAAHGCVSHGTLSMSLRLCVCVYVSSECALRENSSAVYATEGIHLAVSVVFDNSHWVKVKFGRRSNIYNRDGKCEKQLNLDVYVTCSCDMSVCVSIGIQNTLLYVSYDV